MSAQRDNPPGMGRSRPRSKDRAVRAAFVWESPENVPGAVLPASVQKALHERLRRLDEHTRRARVEGATYVIYR